MYKNVTKHTGSVISSVSENIEASMCEAQCYCGITEHIQKMLGKKGV